MIKILFISTLLLKYRITVFKILFFEFMSVILINYNIIVSSEFFLFDPLRSWRRGWLNE